MKVLVTEKDFLRTYKNENFGRIALKKYKRLFPVRASKELAYIIAALMTDGHMEKRVNYHSYKYDMSAFFSEDMNELKRFNETMNYLFGIKGKIRNGE